LTRLKDGKIRTLPTARQKLRGFEEPNGLGRPMGADHSAQKTNSRRQERRDHELTTLR
jgi:putative flavoprotein involved in K+ transport